MLAYILGIAKRAIRGIQNGASIMDCKSRQEDLQIGLAHRISNLGKKITNWRRDFKLWKINFKSGQGVQIEKREILHRGRDYKSVQNKYHY